MRLNTILVGITMGLLLLASPVAASDYTLGIFGNANEDDTINMQDVTYTELIILEYRDRTELADAKYDGEIDILDMTQIALIILGREKELTILDAKERIVTVDKPVDSIIPLTPTSSEITKAIGAKEKVVGVATLFGGDAFFPELSTLPNVGSWMNPDYEAIVELRPDIVIQGSSGSQELEEKIEPAGITVVRLELGHTEEMEENWMKLGYILDRVSNAKELGDWYNERLDEIISRTEGFSDDEKPRVFVAFSYYGSDKAMGNGYYLGPLCTMAGGYNIAGDIEGSLEVDPEWVLERNPDVVVMVTLSSEAANGYDVDDSTGMSEFRANVLSRPAWEHVNAVEDERVYMVGWHMFAGPHALVTTVYMAKWFYPELFDDLYPQAIQQEYLTEFQGLDYDLNEHGVFVYPPLEEI